jgi:hypothetical protein
MENFLDDSLKIRLSAIGIIRVNPPRTRPILPLYPVVKFAEHWPTLH